MLTPELAQRLAVATGLPAKSFQTLYLCNGGTVARWTIGEHEHVFAPAEHHLLAADRFAKRLRLAGPLDATKWGPLMKEVLASATVI